MMPCLVRRFQRLGDLSRDGQGLVERNRTVRDAIRERRALDQFQDEGRMPCDRFFEAVDGGDVWVVQRRQHPGLALEARKAIRI